MSVTFGKAPVLKDMSNLARGYKKKGEKGDSVIQSNSMSPKCDICTQQLKHPWSTHQRE